MIEEYAYIFDMDGTLYNFDSGGFTQSKFYDDLKQRSYAFIAQRLGIDGASAAVEFRRIMDLYDGEVSLGLEAEYGIDRYDLFEGTWSAEPSEYIQSDNNLRDYLSPVVGRSALLTAAPNIWANRVIEYLGVEDVFDSKVRSGEPDIRKPDPAVFIEVAEMLSYPLSNIISIGDQNHSDIVPAKAVGMKTLIIGQEIGDADMCADNIRDAILLMQERGMI